MPNDWNSTVLEPTLDQTVGPYFHVGLAWLFDAHVADASAGGRHIVVEGRVIDGDGAPVSDALLELWQADADGKYPELADWQAGRPAHGFKGFARIPTDDEGRFCFDTVKPGRVPAPDGGLQAPHISVQVFMRGLLRPLLTRIYFASEPANQGDLVLEAVSAARRDTLMARSRPGESDVFEWDVVLQGAHETVFFDG